VDGGRHHLFRFQISKHVIVTGGQAITVCRVVSVYEVIIVNSQLGNYRADFRLDCSAEIGEGVWGLLPAPCPSRGPCN